MIRKIVSSSSRKKENQKNVRKITNGSFFKENFFYFIGKYTPRVEWRMRVPNFLKDFLNIPLICSFAKSLHKICEFF